LGFFKNKFGGPNVIPYICSSQLKTYKMKKETLVCIGLITLIVAANLFSILY